MGQKVNPIANRLGIIKGWESNWFGGNDYGDKLVEDTKIREYLNARLAKRVFPRLSLNVLLSSLPFSTHFETRYLLW
jgi:small subunit ribosomal protein S3